MKSHVPPRARTFADVVTVGPETVSSLVTTLPSAYVVVVYFTLRLVVLVKSMTMKYLLDNNIDFEVSVADQQNYEVMNILNRYKPDLYLSRHPGSTVWAIKNGTPAIYVADEYMIFGYKHTLEFAKTVLDAVRNRSFEENLARRTKLPYTDWWYKQDVNKFLEEAK